ncbi:MAG: hypothetical protein PHT31_05610 [Candidatus Omnitrophica bacterium]|nr:hypothetical protein [Candidatus Omnitrophota bacterium]
MGKIGFILTLATISIFCMADLQASELEWDDIGAENRDIKAVLINPYNPKLIFMAAKNQLLATIDGGKSWQRLLSIKGQYNLANVLSFYPLNNNFLYAATQSGLYFSDNQGRNWRKIFRGRNYLENDCTALKIFPDRIYLGTKAGLFISCDQGRKWEKVIGNLGNCEIFSLAAAFKEPDFIYAACREGVFFTRDAGKSWERIFVATNAMPSEEQDEADLPQEDQETPDSKFLALDPLNSGHLYLADSGKIYLSRDKGKVWEKLTDYGLLSGKTDYLYIAADSRVFVATKSGLFEYSSGRWHELSFGLTVRQIRQIAQDNSGNLYLACDTGIFRSRKNFSHDKLLPPRGNEQIPTIRQVQEAAIKYAEVEPKKIIRWRKQAAKRAFLPRVSASINRDAGDLWHWESGSSTKSGDDALIKGRDSLGWDVTLSWDLAEVIWSDAQTAIDTRSRLMVQLREDVLDEVTKIYFERIRIKREINSFSLEEKIKLQEKTLRLQELEAYLDGLTGGYFSLHNLQ